MQQQNLLNQEVKDELGKPSRLDAGFPDDLKGSYDEFGFEKREARKAYLPIFIPFDQIMVRDEQLEKIKHSKRSLVDKKNDMINAILQQKTLEYYVFNDLNTVLCKGQIKQLLKNVKGDQSSRSLGAGDEPIVEEAQAPDLNVLKEYILKH